ncbi:hypothetical protein CN1A_16 [Clavibacter phage CN1A]|uniref:Uncharacterized protein n=1 Tax=Clavibacter phage CN1A TaxID=1406793 RepID=U5PT60_9CAUD|nr:hypothetical protein CN1A_16 [Clavibacter phage CN1A]AGY47125.1 hypothetical protein CN1A_16 [Clavibacter phage CN1A]
MTTAVPQIYGLISAAAKKAGALPKETSAGVKYSFRGVDSTVNHLAPVLDEFGIVTVPVVLEFELIDKVVNGKNTTTAKILYGVDFFAPDGTSIRAITPGQSMDYSDKAAAQAASVAYRIALLQTFHLPTDSPDPELSQIGNEDENNVAGQSIKQAAAATKRPTVTASQAGNEPAASKVTDLVSEARQEGGKRGLDGKALNALSKTLVDGFSMGNQTHLKALVKHLKALPLPDGTDQATGEVTE